MIERTFVLSAVVALTLGLSACKEAPVEPGPSPTPAEEEWVHPTFSGDGLPPSENTDHETSDNIGDQTQAPGDDDDTPEEPELVIVDGLFSWSSQDGVTFSADLVLMSETITCHTLFGAQDGLNPDGIYYDVRPRMEDTGPVWEGEFPLCGQPPCVTGYTYVGGEYTELEPGATLTIQSYDVHYVTASWDTGSSSGSDLRFYNCGDVKNWNY